MGLISSSAHASTLPQNIAPNRTQRAACWEARDGFFACLAKHDIIDAIKEAPKAKSVCGTQEAAFERDCVGSWVFIFCFYFFPNGERERERARARRNEG